MIEQLTNWNSLVDILKALAAIGARGGVISLITSALVGANWPGQAKGLVAFLACVIGAFLMVLVSGVDLTNLVVAIPTMWIMCHLLYIKWFKPSGLAPWIETLFLNRG